MKPRTLLFLPSHEASLKEMLVLADALAATHRYRCAFVIAWPCGDRWRKAITGKRHQLILEAADPGANGHGDSQPSVAPPLPGVLANLRKYWQKYRRADERALQLLDHIAPAAIITPSDRLIGLETALIARGRKRGVPTLVVPWAVATTGGSASYRLSQSDFEVRYGMGRAINRIVARCRPSAVTEADGRRMLFMPGESIIAASLMKGLMPPHPWRPIGSGLASRIAVESPRAMRSAVDAGTAVDRLALTGRASTDAVYQQIRYAVEGRRRLCERFGLRHDRRLIVCSVPKLAEHRLCTWEDHWRQIEFFFGVLGSLSGADVVLNLHPKSKPDDYEKRAAAHGLRLAADTPIEQLIPLCDLYICPPSSTVVIAIGCAKPVVIAHLYGMMYDVFDQCEGVTTVRERNELKPALHRLLEDRLHYQRMSTALSRLRDDWIMFDGRCIERLIAEVDALVLSKEESNEEIDDAVAARS